MAAIAPTISRFFRHSIASIPKSGSTSTAIDNRTITSPFVLATSQVDPQHQTIATKMDPFYPGALDRMDPQNTTRSTLNVLPLY